MSDDAPKTRIVGSVLMDTRTNSRTRYARTRSVSDDACDLDAFHCIAEERHLATHHQLVANVHRVVEIEVDPVQNAELPRKIHTDERRVERRRQEAIHDQTGMACALRELEVNVKWIRITRNVAEGRHHR